MERDLLDLSHRDREDLLIGISIKSDAALGFGGAHLSWCSFASAFRHKHAVDHEMIEIKVLERGDLITRMTFMRRIVS